MEQLAQMAQLIREGGPVLYLLAALSVLSLSLILWKVIDLAGVTGGAARRDRALAAWAAGDRDGAQAELAAGRAPADRLGAAAMAAIRAGIGGALLDADLTRRGNAEMARMSQGVRVLELIAMISPLLGLLGTVTGMIESFQMLAEAGGSANASVMAGGIWEALLTTAAGLIVAIPAAIAAALFATRVDSVGQEMEVAVGQLLAVENRRMG